MSLRPRILLGFFGVRGAAAIFDATAATGAHVLPAYEQHVVVWTTIAGVITSILVHGLGATPLTDALLSPGSNET